MRSRLDAVARAVVALTTVGTVLVASGGSAWAHPTDELLQLVYVTPAAGAVQVEIDLVPGELVAEAYVDQVDVDHDGRVSTSEADAHAAAVAATVRVTVDGTGTAVRLRAHDTPDTAVLRAGGTPIVLLLEADLPSVPGPHAVEVVDAYAPLRTTVQMSVTLDATRSVDVGAVEHEQGGAAMAVRYTIAAAGPATGRGTVTDDPRFPAVPVAVAGALGGLSCLVLTGRRRIHRRGRRRPVTV